MKKFFTIISILVVCCAFASCNNAKDTKDTTTESMLSEITEESTCDTKNDTTESEIELTTTGEAEESTGELNIGDIDVDNGLLTVKLEIPSTFVTAKTEEEAQKMNDEDDGIIEYTLHDDGSATVVYTKESYGERLSELKENFISQMEEICSQYKTISRIECDDDMRNIKVYITSENDYNNSLDCYALCSVHIYCGSYQVMKGEYDEIKTYYSLIDDTTGKEFKTNVLPDDIEEKFSE